MSWNIRDNRNFFLKLKSQLELYHVVLTTPKTSADDLTLTVVEMQQMPSISKKKVLAQNGKYLVGQKYV